MNSNSNGDDASITPTRKLNSPLYLCRANENGEKQYILENRLPRNHYWAPIVVGGERRGKREGNENLSNKGATIFL